MRILLILSLLLLVGWNTPEKFTSKIEFINSTELKHEYTGTIVNLLNASVLKSGKALTPRHQKAADDLCKKFTSCDKKSATNYSIKNVEILKIKSKQSLLFDMINIYSDGKKIEVFGKKINDKSIKELSRLGIVMDGKLEIVLPKEAKNIRSNADSNSGNSYKWNMNNSNKSVEIVFEVK